MTTTIGIDTPALRCADAGARNVLLSQAAPAVAAADTGRHVTGGTA